MRKTHCFHVFRRHSPKVANRLAIFGIWQSSGRLASFNYFPKKTYGLGVSTLPSCPKVAKLTGLAFFGIFQGIWFGKNHFQFPAKPAFRDLTPSRSLARSNVRSAM